MNIILYGDSIMKGVIYDSEKNRYTLFNGAFANRIKEKLNATVTNAAKFGNTIGRTVKKLYADISNSKPDVVVFELGGNDCDYNWKEISEHPDREHQPNTGLEEFKGYFAEILSMMKQNRIITAVLTLPPISSVRYFSWISGNNPKASKNILKWLGDVEHIYRWQERYNTAIYDIIKKNGSILIDIRKAFMEKPDFTEYLCLDGIHPNEKGHELIYREIEKHLEEHYPFLFTYI